LKHVEDRRDSLRPGTPVEGAPPARARKKREVGCKGVAPNIEAHASRTAIHESSEAFRALAVGNTSMPDAPAERVRDSNVGRGKEAERQQIDGSKIVIRGG